MLDGAGVGRMFFQSPSSDGYLNDEVMWDQRCCVFFTLYGNYSGDLINFDMAGEISRFCME